MNIKDFPADLRGDLAGWYFKSVWCCGVDDPNGYGDRIKIVGYYWDAAYAKTLWQSKGAYGTGPILTEMAVITNGDKAFLLETGIHLFEITPVKKGDVDVRTNALAKLTPEEIKILRRDGI